MWSYILVDKNAPQEVKDAIILGRQRISGPNGMQQKDDMENWYIQTRYSKGFTTRWRLRQNNQLGMSRPSLHGPSNFGLPGMFHSYISSIAGPLSWRPAAGTICVLKSLHLQG